MFVLAKGNFPDISDDLVNCYHLLLCVIDWVYINCVVGKRTDLINQEFCGKKFHLPLMTDYQADALFLRIVE